MKVEKKEDIKCTKCGGNNIDFFVGKYYFTIRCIDCNLHIYFGKSKFRPTEDPAVSQLDIKNIELYS